MLSRPFESVFLMLSCAVFLVPHARRILRLAPAIVAAVLPAVALTLLHDKRVTGDWLTLPNSLSRYEYGVPAAFTTQPNPVPHRDLTREQQLDYQIQSAVHGPETDTVSSYFTRLATRARFYRFFFLAPLYIAILAFLFTRKDSRFIWMMVAVLLFGLGTTFYPYFYSHYIAALTCIFVLMSVIGLQRLGPTLSHWIFAVCVAQFALWYAAHLIGDPAMWQYETWDAINYGDPDGRIAVHRELAALAGKQLVFVRYSSQHTTKEWVYNAADIDGARVVWARDLGFFENEKLRRYYPDRTAWLVEPDLRPVHLKPYVIPTPQESPAPNPARPHLKFEEVH